MPEVLFIAFKVPGVAYPSGSKTAFVPTNKKTKQPYRDRHGRIIVNVVDSCKQSGPWKATIGRAAREAMKSKGLTTIDAKTEGHARAIPLKAIFRFYITRPKAHFRTGKFSNVLRDDAPQFPTSPADVLKLSRSAEDSLTGIVYKDDSAIVREVISKEWGLQDYLLIEIWLLK